MGKEANPEKELSKNIDKILSGQELELDLTQSDEYRNAIDFAQKMIGLRATPQPAFQASLKARLLAKLRETGQETKPGVFWAGFRSILQNPVWRAVTPIVVIVLAIGVLWATGILPGTGEVTTPPLPVPTAGPQRPPLDISVTASKNTYLLGEDVKIDFTFKNVSSSSVQVQPFPPLVEIMRPNVNKPVRSFSAGTGAKPLNPGEVTGFTVTWNQRDSQDQQVTYGYYYIELGDIQVGAWHMKPSFGMTAPILILPAEGVMEKTVEVNKYQTASGITITLERVELSTSGMKVYVFNTPPGYSSAPGPGAQPPPPPMMISAFAEYSIDGGVIKQAGPSAIRFLDKGMEHIWENFLDPVPKTAKELTFRVIKLGDWQGPWEFRLSLQ